MSYTQSTLFGSSQWQFSLKIITKRRYHLDHFREFYCSRKPTGRLEMCKIIEKSNRLCVGSWINLNYSRWQILVSKTKIHIVRLGPRLRHWGREGQNECELGIVFVEFWQWRGCANCVRATTATVAHYAQPLQVATSRALWRSFAKQVERTHNGRALQNGYCARSEPGWNEK